MHELESLLPLFIVISGFCPANPSLNSFINFHQTKNEALTLKHFLFTPSNNDFILFDVVFDLQSPRSDLIKI
jgi:hypothetical protein